jgi:hypothetical protein
MVWLVLSNSSSKKEKGKGKRNQKFKFEAGLAEKTNPAYF